MCCSRRAARVNWQEVSLGLKDQDGKYLVQALADIANGPGSGWVDYKWPNPVNNKIEDKSSYVEKMGDYFVGVADTRR